MGSGEVSPSVYNNTLTTIVQHLTKVWKVVLCISCIFVCLLSVGEIKAYITIANVAIMNSLKIKHDMQLNEMLYKWAIISEISVDNSINILVPTDLCQTPYSFLTYLTSF